MRAKVTPQRDEPLLEIRFVVHEGSKAHKHLGKYNTDGVYDAYVDNVQCEDCGRDDTVEVFPYEEVGTDFTAYLCKECAEVRNKEGK